VPSQNCERRQLVSLCLSVRPSVRPHGTTRLPLRRFSWNLIWIFFENLSGKFKLHWNRTRILSALHENQRTFLIMSRSVLIRMRGDSDRFVENIKAHIFCSITFFQNPAVWERCGKIFQSGAGHRWHYVVRGIPKATNTRSE
jgi:hypothetical protein